MPRGLARLRCVSKAATLSGEIPLVGLLVTGYSQAGKPAWIGAEGDVDGDPREHGD